MKVIGRHGSWLFVALFLALTAACGTTAIVESHPALAKNGEIEVAKVYFLRPDIGYRGVARNAFSISLDNQNLLTLATGEYALVYLRPMSATLTVESSTVVRQGGANVMTRVQESVPFAFEAGQTYYLAFVGKQQGWMSGGAVSYLPVLMSRTAATATASGLKPVGSAVQEPIVRKGS